MISPDSPLSAEEKKDRQAVEVLWSVSPDVKATGFHYGFHMHCFD